MVASCVPYTMGIGISDCQIIGCWDEMDKDSAGGMVSLYLVR